MPEKEGKIKYIRLYMYGYTNISFDINFMKIHLLMHVKINWKTYYKPNEAYYLVSCRRFTIIIILY